MSELNTITTDVLNPVVPAITEQFEATVPVIPTTLQPASDLSIIAMHFGDIDMSNVDEISGEFGE